MLAVAGAHETRAVLDQIVEGIAACGNVALVRIWLIVRQEDDRGERAWLQLAASAGNLAGADADPKRLDGRFARFEIGERKIGGVAASGAGVLISDIEQDERWIADPVWAISEGIRAFAAQPLIARAETLGVIGLFDRSGIDDEDFGWLRTFADHAAVAISNARAFEEIESLRGQLKRENDYLREELSAEVGELHGQSAAMAKLRSQIAIVAPTDASVLILGESGVGKELAARAVHEASHRAEHPLVKVNCGAVPGELFESEFFGHVRGAFTGAQRDRIGRFELANGGTIFLDEVGEIPLERQAKLLRVLQEGTYERVGDETTRRVDVRVIAATNRNLMEEVRAGRFRADLYYRLGVFPLELPPLRERLEDLGMLAELFVAKAARRLRRPAPRISRSLLRRFEAYHWPGNVRELQHVIERAVILSPGRTLECPDLDLEAPSARSVEILGEAPTTELTMADLKALEREVILRAWEAAGRKVSGPGGAAEALGVPPTTLQSKLKAHGLK
ncbi:MAG: sigma 54-interacting transcriptional regulator [Planctomycetes bacterium]|nr:sigma 54-interacting transcriptional regulator [Planctomycetota bacterium]